MRLSSHVLAALAASSLAAIVSSARQVHFEPPRPPFHLAKRDLAPRSTKSSCVVDCFDDVAGEDIDYIVIGGGTAGLAIASRLSEDAAVKVLVVEAGPSGYEDDAKLLTPNGAYYHSALNTKYDWNYTTTVQAGLDGRRVRLPRGRTLGGSSAINGLYYVRHGIREGLALARIAAQLAGSGESGWSWKAVRKAMDAAISFRSPVELPYIADAIAPISEALGGGDGPTMISFPETSFEVQSAWLAAFKEMGIAAAVDAYGGDNNGALIAPTTVDSKTLTRSSSRTAYLDGLPETRSNLQILIGHTVTRIHLEQPSAKGEKARAVGVECAASKEGKRHTFKARREVILAAGAIGSPQILQLSGIGQSELLKKHNIAIVKDLPGVGHHLQDHVSTAISYSVNGGVALQNASTTSYTDSAIAYLGLADLLGSQKEADQFISRAKKLTASYISKAADSHTPACVRKGWTRTMGMLLTDLLSEKSPSGFNGSAKGAMEILLSTMNQHIGIEQALQAPFSRGSVKIRSSDAFQAPDIDTAYLSHPADIQLLLAGYAFSRKLASSDALKPYIDQESSATSGLSTKAQIEQWLRATVGTEYHLSSSCSMLPEDEGGVVGADLKVHGFLNLRVADASVIPISPTTHLVSYVYGLAEIAALKIKADWSAHGEKEVRTKGSSTVKEHDNSASTKSASSGAHRGSGKAAKSAEKQTSHGSKDGKKGKNRGSVESSTVLSSSNGRGKKPARVSGSADGSSTHGSSHTKNAAISHMGNSVGVSPHGDVLDAGLDAGLALGIEVGLGLDLATHLDISALSSAEEALGDDSSNIAISVSVEELVPDFGVGVGVGVGSALRLGGLETYSAPGSGSVESDYSPASGLGSGWSSYPDSGSGSVESDGSSGSGSRSDAGSGSRPGSGSAESDGSVSAATCRSK